MQGQLIIQNGDKKYYPAVVENVVWTTERCGSPSKLEFKVIKDDVLNFTEGNQVTFYWDSAPIFHGYVFTKKRDKEDIISVVAYDQLRYLKNKDTYVYTNKTASDVLKLIAEDFNLQLGTVDDTGYKIPSRTEDSQTLFDIIQNALDLTIQNKKDLYILYDDFGKIALRHINNMKVNILIDSETAKDFSYTSSIDEATYNKIKLVYDNEATGKRDVYVEQSGENMNAWGTLQYYDSLEEGENGIYKAKTLLQLYNKKTRKLTIDNAFGDVRVRAGCMIGVHLLLGDVELNNWMLVESCKHTFKLDEHYMDITVRGGEFIG